MLTTGITSARIWISAPASERASPLQFQNLKESNIMHWFWRSYSDTLRALGLILALAVYCPEGSAAEGGRTREQWQGFEVVLEEPVREVRHERLDPEEGRAVLFDWIEAVNGAPTFVFMPGLGFTMPINHAAYAELSRQGFGIVAMNFSTHIPSVLALGDNASPYFLSRSPDSRDFASEVNLIADFLRTRGAKNIIPVSLSYSGMVSAHLHDYPLIIDTAPLTSAMAAASVGESIRASLEMVNLFNPFRKQLVRQAMDALYKNYWTQAVASTGGVPEGLRSRVIEAYMAMSRASEGYDSARADYALGQRRLFILGGQERPSLLLDQRRTIHRLKLAGHDVQVKEIASAGHLVANEVDAFAGILSEAGRAVQCRTALLPD
jgi:hypothetical protein